MMYGEEKKSNLKKTLSSSTFGTKIADSKMGTQCGGGVLFLHQQHSAVGPRAAGSEEHVQGGGLRGDQASKFGFCPRARAQAEVKSPAIHILRPLSRILRGHGGSRLRVCREHHPQWPLSTSRRIVYIKAEVESPAISNCTVVQRKLEHKDYRKDPIGDVYRQQNSLDDVSRPNHKICGIVLKCIRKYYPRAKEFVLGQ